MIRGVDNVQIPHFEGTAGIYSFKKSLSCIDSFSCLLTIKRNHWSEEQ